MAEEMESSYSNVEEQFILVTTRTEAVRAIGVRDAVANWHSCRVAAFWHPCRLDQLVLPSVRPPISRWNLRREQMLAKEELAKEAVIICCNLSIP